MNFEVIRYSGRIKFGVPEKRTIYSGTDGDRARKIYKKIEENMRQGRIELWEGSARKAVREAYNLRTKW